MRSRLEPVILTLALSLGACSDDTVGPTAGKFEELCGETAPIRLLPLDPDRVPYSASSKAFGDRYVFSVRYGDFSQQGVTEIWSVGRCGEDPTQLVDGVESWIWGGVAPWPDLPFVCDEAGERILALDPNGVRPPQEVFETRDCHTRMTPSGLVTILGDGDTGPLVLQRLPEDPLAEAAEHVVLVDEVKARALPSPHTSPGEHEVLAMTESEVFAITAADQLVVISLDDLEVGVLAEGVREFEIGRSGRYVFFQGVEITNDNPEWPEGPIFLLDRESGETTQLDETALAYTLPSALVLESLGLLHYRVGAADDETADRWVRLDTLESYTVPGLIWPLGAIDDTTAMLGRAFDTPLYLLDVSTGELTFLYDGPSYFRYYHEDGLYIFQEKGGAVIDLRFSGETRTLARHVTTRWVMLSGERVVTPYAVGDDNIGSLVIVDPNTLDETYIDHDVLSISTTTPDASWPLLGDLISYIVVDGDPDRHGIWLAKPAK